MNINDFDKNKQQAIDRIFESRFGSKITLNAISRPTAIKLLKKVTEAINSYKQSSNYHLAERDQRYTELLVLREGLHAKISDLTKSKQSFRLTEGEIAAAEAVLAAKDFVDRVQKMIEDTGRMMNEDLPPLSDIIRDQIGAAESEQYVAIVSEKLSELHSVLQDTRTVFDNAARALAGEAEFGADMTLPGNDDSSTDMDDVDNLDDLDDLDDLDSDENMDDLADLDVDNEDEELEAPEVTSGVGRETR